MSYVDGFVLAVPKQNIEEYREFSTKCGEIWREHGALEYWECVADDVKPGTLTSFPQAVQLKPDETVVFSWIRYESRAARDAINEKVMADPRLNGMEEMHKIFDGKRMIFGGFEVIVSV